MSIVLRAESFRLLQLLIVCTDLVRKSEKKDTSFMMYALALFGVGT